MGRKRPWRGSKDWGNRGDRKRERKDAPDGGEQGVDTSSGQPDGYGVRKVFDGAHPGSYAGDLSKQLSAEERLELEVAATAAEVVEMSKRPKKKVAVLLAYCGTKYKGMQINPNQRTVEAELERALYLVGNISRANFGNLQKIICLRMSYVEGKEKETIAAINRHLPEDIKVVDMRRVPKGFDAKQACSRRRYEYFMPTAMLAATDHVAGLYDEARQWAQDNESSQPSNMNADNAAEEGGGSEVEQREKKIASVAETSRSAVIAPSGSNLPSTSDLSASEPGEGSSGAGICQGTAGVSVASVSEESAEKVTVSGLDGAKTITPEEDASEDNSGEGGGDLDVWVSRRPPSVVAGRVSESLRKYRVTAELLDSLRRVLGCFKGTKNYHNYTSRRKANDPSCSRYIISFVSSDPWTAEDGSEWIRLTVVGQSFLLHQIRKMVATAVDLVRRASSPGDFDMSFSLAKLNLNIAPSEGLYLDRPFFDTYNRILKKEDKDRVLEWESGPEAEELEEFKRAKIHQHILSQEQSEHNFVAWLDVIGSNPCVYKPKTAAPTVAANTTEGTPASESAPTPADSCSADGKTRKATHSS